MKLERALLMAMALTLVFASMAFAAHPPPDIDMTATDEYLDENRDDFAVESATITATSESAKIDATDDNTKYDATDFQVSAAPT